MQSFHSPHAFVDIKYWKFEFIKWKLVWEIIINFDFRCTMVPCHRLFVEWSWFCISFSTFFLSSILTVNKKFPFIGPKCNYNRDWRAEINHKSKIDCHATINIVDLSIVKEKKNIINSRIWIVKYPIYIHIKIIIKLIMSITWWLGIQCPLSSMHAFDWLSFCSPFQFLFFHHREFGSQQWKCSGFKTLLLMQLYQSTRYYTNQSQMRQCHSEFNVSYVQFLEQERTL